MFMHTIKPTSSSASIALPEKNPRHFSLYLIGSASWHVSVCYLKLNYFPCRILDATESDAPFLQTLVCAVKWGVQYFKSIDFVLTYVAQRLVGCVSTWLHFKR